MKLIKKELKDDKKINNMFISKGKLKKKYLLFLKIKNEKSVDNFKIWHFQPKIKIIYEISINNFRNYLDIF